MLIYCLSIQLLFALFVFSMQIVPQNKWTCTGKQNLYSLQICNNKICLKIQMHFMELQNALYGISLYLPMFSLTKTQSDPKHPTQHHYRATVDICGIMMVTVILRPSWIRLFHLFIFCENAQNISRTDTREGRDTNMQRNSWDRMLTWACRISARGFWQDRPVEPLKLMLIQTLHRSSAHLPSHRTSIPAPTSLSLSTVITVIMKH